MIPNPGGVITGEAIVDREKEINSIWRALKNQSVVLSSERRVGKTSILRKMQEHPQDEWIPILYWVESKQHPIEFIEGLYEEFSKRKLVKNNFKRLTHFYSKYVGGEKIGSWQLPQLKDNWKNLLDSLLEDIVDSGKKVLLMFDELPLMLSKLKGIDGIGPMGCMEFLDTLREMRNKYEPSKKIVFIFCGSIGINLVIKDLKDNHAYNSDPINNMKKIGISGMDKEGAHLLCRKLTENEVFRVEEQEALFDYITKITDALPFYIQLVFDYFYENDIIDITKKAVDNAIDAIIDDVSDQGFFRHYLDRINTYYDKSLVGIALFILDNICLKKSFWVETEIINTVKQDRDADNNKIKEALNLLREDHYLERKIKDSERTYRFKYSLLKRWWKVNRGN